LEQGRAQAGALRLLVEQYRKAGPAAREVLALQKMLPLVGAISGASNTIAVRKMTMLPRGEPSDVARAAIGTAEQLRAATGIDLGAIAKRLGAGTVVGAATGSTVPPQVRAAKPEST
jgi:flotillin